MGLLELANVPYSRVESWQKILKIDGTVEIRVANPSSKGGDPVAIFPDEVGRADTVPPPAKTAEAGGA